MKTLTRTNYFLITAGIALLGLSSCKKDNLSAGNEDLLINGALEVTAATISSDAVYVVNTCERGGKLDSVAFSALPASVGTYLTANYAGYTFQKAFSSKTAAGIADGFIVIVQFNGKPVGLKFDTAGTFIKVLEQREKRDLKNKGWHPGGRFDGRDGMRRDTIALTALSAGIKAYFVANYAQDTLLHAIHAKDGSFVVISTNKGLFATVFTSASVFVKRAALPQPQGKRNDIALTSIPVKAQTYLTTTYPGYSFHKAFELKSATGARGYVVLIDASGTKYSVEFDASGTFVKVVAIR